MMRTLFLASIGFTLLSATSAWAQDPLLAQLYGSGVHAFFAGDYQQADNDLTAAINGGSKDPRAYYFRALCNLRTGRSQEANADFQRGADLESADVNQTFGVSRALERVQGSQRAMLEKYRLRARIAAHQMKEGQRQAGYQKRRDADSLLVRQAVPPPSAAAVQQNAAGGAPAAETENPFGEAPKITPTERPVEAKGGEPTGADTANPFGAGPPAEMPPAETAPPASSPPPSSGPPPSSTPPAGGTTPPPNTPAPSTPPSSGDPFGPEGPPK